MQTAAALNPRDFMKPTVLFMTVYKSMSLVILFLHVNKMFHGGWLKVLGAQLDATEATIMGCAWGAALVGVLSLQVSYYIRLDTHTHSIVLHSLQQIPRDYLLPTNQLFPLSHV